MENLFIQSTINDQGQTFLEVGFEDGLSTLIPSEFHANAHNHITIAVTRKDFWGLQADFGISDTDVLGSLINQFPNDNVNLIIGSKTVKKFR
jgi:hypothetical protein